MGGEFFQEDRDAFQNVPTFRYLTETFLENLPIFYF